MKDKINVIKEGESGIVEKPLSFDFSRQSFFIGGRKLILESNRNYQWVCNKEAQNNVSWPFGPSGLPNQIYIGIGYNKSLLSAGERLDMLDYFGMIKLLIDSKLVDKFFIYDAAGYEIVNLMSPKKIEALGSEPSARSILEILVEEQEKPKRRELRENLDLRTYYLKRLIKISGIEFGESRTCGGDGGGLIEWKCGYIDSQRVFRQGFEIDQSGSIEESPTKFFDAFDIALDFVQRIRVDNPEMLEQIYQKNAASKLYVPLEIAEAIFLEFILNVSGKFGPEKEEVFDKLILAAQDKKPFGFGENPYIALRCPSGPFNAAYLARPNNGNGLDVVTTKSPKEVVKMIATDDKIYREYAKTFLAPFRKDGEEIGSCIIRMNNVLRGEDL